MEKETEKCKCDGLLDLAGCLIHGKEHIEWQNGGFFNEIIHKENNWEEKLRPRVSVLLPEDKLHGDALQMFLDIAWKKLIPEIEKLLILAIKEERVSLLEKCCESCKKELVISVK